VTDRTRAAGVLGALGGVAAIVLAPLVAAASTAAAQVERGVSPTVNPVFGAFLSFDTPQAVYLAYSKVWLGVLLAFLVAALALRTRVGAQLGARGERGFQALLVGLAGAAVGNLADFWIALGPSAATIVHVVFSVGGLLVAMAGATLVGFEARKANALPRSASTMLTVAFLGIPLLAIVPNWPAAPLLWSGAGWLSVGLWLAAPPAAERAGSDVTASPPAA
jgi:hypothetical protein